MLRGFSEIPPDPASDGAFPQALVLGELGDRFRLQRLVHSETDQKQGCSSVTATATCVLRGQTEADGGEDQS